MVTKSQDVWVPTRKLEGSNVDARFCRILGAKSITCLAERDIVHGRWRRNTDGAGKAAAPISRDDGQVARGDVVHTFGIIDHRKAGGLLVGLFQI
jgi:hypothetical protein